MPGSPEVKTALAFARTMRHPAGSLLAWLDRIDRTAQASWTAPDFLDIDPSAALGALMASTPVADRSAAVPRTARATPDLPARRATPTARATGAPTPLRPGIAPAPAVASSATADKPEAEATVPQQRRRAAKPLDLAALRDAVRRGESPPLERTSWRHGRADAVARDNGGRAEADPRDTDSRDAESQRRTRAGDAPTSLAQDQVRSFPDLQTPAMARGGLSLPDKPTTTSPALALPTTRSAPPIDPMTLSPLDNAATSQPLAPAFPSVRPTQAGDTPSPRAAGPGTATQAAGQPLAISNVTIPLLHGQRREPASSPTSHPRRNPSPHDAETALAEAFWRLGIDQP